MENLIITKSTAGVWQLQESSDGTELDGVIFGGNVTSVNYFNKEVTFETAKETRTYICDNVFYEDTSYPSPLELLDVLKTAGFTGNFNQGGGTPLNPADYDLSEFTNTSADPFVKESESIQMGVVTLEADTTPNSTVTDVAIPSFTFTVPAGKYVSFEVIAPFTSASTTTGLGLVARLATSVGANGNVVGTISTDSRLSSSTIGRVSNKVDLGANATANYDSLSGISTAGSTNNAIIMGKLNNLATNTDATVTILFRSEVAGSAVVIEKGATLDWITK